MLSGVLHDPHTGKVLPHVHRRAPLGAAWRGGAYAWTPQRRLEYANDLDVLLAVDTRTNCDKGSKTAATWRPPRRAYGCECARRYTSIKDEYGLSVTAPEKLVLQDLLATCPQ
ncbi:DUF1524 domain-containing protein [Streptomyces sp. NPDC056544]|uniref:GmrSD restriction endonuclease domain-containing protein n=1 Tax=unclassified Streptomyces TaxID=2593676 RepID=UPI0036A65DDE